MSGRCLCSRCGERPRLARQRWCRACLTAAQRERRAARRAEGQSRAALAGAATMPLSSPRAVAETGGTGDPPSHPSLVAPGVPEARVARLVGSGEVSPTLPIHRLHDGATEALDRYRRAQAELDRVTHGTDWRRSLYAPPTVLQPLVDAVARARAECRALGLTPDGAVTRATAAGSCCLGPTGNGRTRVPPCGS